MLEIFLRKVKSVAVLDLSGDINIDSANLVEKVGWCLDNGYKNILCNLESVGLVDFTGLSALGLAYKDCVNHNARMKLAKVPLHIKKKFELVCLDRVFEFYDDEKSALRSFEGDKAIAEIQKKHLRRRFKRLPLDVQVSLKTSREAEFHKAKMLNISGVGMLIFIEKAYPLGEVVTVRLSLRPVAESIEVQAKVVWLVDKKIQPQIYPGMGLEFYHLDSELQEKVLQFVERNLPMDSCP
ncbi:MAG: PilZ domain-containing protein [Deltaproteobacteria bacterium]